MLWDTPHKIVNNLSSQIEISSVLRDAQQGPLSYRILQIKTGWLGDSNFSSQAISRSFSGSKSTKFRKEKGINVSLHWYLSPWTTKSLASRRHFMKCIKLAQHCTTTVYSNGQQGQYSPQERELSWDWGVEEGRDLT